MPRVRLRTMTREEFADFEQASIAGYAQDLGQSVTGDDEAALAYSRDEFRKLLPDGLDTRGHVVAIAEDADSGDAVGILWMQLGDPRGLDADQAFILDIEIWEPLWGRGYGKALMAAAEDEARRAGKTWMGLNVFGHNPRARGMYESLGYETVSVQMRKAL